MSMFQTHVINVRGQFSLKHSWAHIDKHTEMSDFNLPNLCARLKLK